MGIRDEEGRVAQQSSGTEPVPREAGHRWPNPTQERILRPATTAPTRIVDVDGRKVEYLSEGTGPAIVLLHGDGDTARDWRWVMPGLVEAGHQVVALTLPGYGSSSPTESHTPEAHAQQVAATLEALGIEQPTVVGNSLGGLVAIHLALGGYPVERLVLVASAGLGNMVNPQLAAVTLPRVGEAAIAAALLPGGSRLRAAGRGLQLAARPWRVPAGWWKDQIRWGANRQHLETAVAAKRASVDMLGQRHIVLDRLAEIRVPTLVIWGKLDLVVPYTHGQDAVRHLPDGHLVLLPRCGHAPPVEKPADFVEALLDFLSKPPGSGGPAGGRRGATTLTGLPALEAVSRRAAETIRRTVGSKMLP